MPRKRKSDQPTKEPEAATVTAVAEPEPAEDNGDKPTFAERVGRKSERLPVPDPFAIAGDNVAGVRLFESKRDRQMAIGFDDKPSQPVIDMLKEAGYRWNPSDRVWTHPVRQESAMSTRIDAERLYQDARQMIRQDKGIETAPRSSLLIATRHGCPMTVPPTSFLHDLGPQAQRMSKDCGNRAHGDAAAICCSGLDDRHDWTRREPRFLSRGVWITG